VRRQTLVPVSLDPPQSDGFSTFHTALENSYGLHIVLLIEKPCKAPYVPHEAPPIKKQSTEGCRRTRCGGPYRHICRKILQNCKTWSLGGSKPSNNNNNAIPTPLLLRKNVKIRFSLILNPLQNDLCRSCLQMAPPSLAMNRGNAIFYPMHSH
jgi:hypothetical protein